MLRVLHYTSQSLLFGNIANKGAYVQGFIGMDVALRRLVVS